MDRFQKSYWVTVVLLIASIFVVQYFSYSTIRPLLKPNLEEIPKLIGGWEGKDESFPPEVYEKLVIKEAGSILLRRYTSQKEEFLWLYIGYFNDNLSLRVHNPDTCYVGGGWKIVSRQIRQIPISKAHPFQLNVVEMLVEKDGEKRLVLFWFIPENKLLMRAVLSKLFMQFKTLITGEAQGAIVRVEAIAGEDDIEGALTKGIEFIRLLAPHLQRILF